MRWTAVRALVGVAVVAAASVSGAQDALHPLPRVRLLAVNRAGLRAEMLAAAEDDATDVYRAAGVRTTWLNAGPQDSSNDYAIDFTLMIVSGHESRTVAAHTNQDAMGFALRDSTDDGSLNGMAFVLFDRVEDNATKYHVSISRVLGAVIAHEVGHLLLPLNSHSDRGIMRASWNMKSSLLDYFTSAQAETIRQRLMVVRGLVASSNALPVQSPRTMPVHVDAPGLFTRVRSTQRPMIALLREGYDRSPTFRELVDTLQQSNIIVFVQPAVCARGRIRSCLTSVNGSGLERHIRISVDTRTSHNSLIATMAHELQHAVEIAEHLEVIDAASALRLYRRIAFGRCREGLSDECETSRALDTEATVMKELYAETPENGSGRAAVCRSATTAGPVTGSGAHVRSTNATILALLKEGAGRSSTFCSLSDAVNQATGIVYVEFGYCAFGHLNGCLLPFIANSEGIRYVRILVTPDKNRRDRNQLLALIAHEMRHALEVLEHEEVVDIPTMEAMYRTIGTPLSGQHVGYETSAARAVGDAVLSELVAK
jgi:hypothetical protein